MQTPFVKEENKSYVGYGIQKLSITGYTIKQFEKDGKKSAIINFDCVNSDGTTGKFSSGFIADKVIKVYENGSWVDHPDKINETQRFVLLIEEWFKKTDKEEVFLQTELLDNNGVLKVAYLDINFSHLEKICALFIPLLYNAECWVKLTGEQQKNNAKFWNYLLPTLTYKKRFFNYTFRSLNEAKNLVKEGTLTTLVCGAGESWANLTFDSASKYDVKKNVATGVVPDPLSMQAPSINIPGEEQPAINPTDLPF